MGQSRELKESAEKGLVRILKKAGSDAIALTSLNTLPMVAVETLFAGMSLHDSANVRLAVSATNPLFGGVREIVQDKASRFFPNIDKKRRESLDIGLGIAVGITELATNFTKYYLVRMLNSQELNFSDLKATFFASLYTMFAGDLMGIALDTYRDGLGIERKENSRSIFPRTMGLKAKKYITCALCTATMLGFEEFYRRTR